MSALDKRFVDWSAINGLLPPDDGEVLWGPPGPPPHILGNWLIFGTGLEAQVEAPPAATELQAGVVGYRGTCRE